MPFILSIRNYLFSSIPPKSPSFQLPNCLLFSTYSSSAAEIFLTHLQENQVKVETALSSVKAKLDSSCITQVLKQCSVDKPQLGLRFFIWTGIQSNQRHGLHMYDKACKSLEIDRNPQIVYDVLDAYKAEDFNVSVKMFKVVLNLCRAAKDAKLGLLVLRKMKEFNCRPDTVSYNLVIRLMVENGELNEALGLLKEMGLIDLYPDMITYVSIIKGLCDAGKLDDAFRLVKFMKGHGCEPNFIVYSTLLDGICTHGSLERALGFLDEMEKEKGSCKPNLVTYTTVIKGFVEKGKAMEAVKFVDRIIDSGVKPNRVTIATIFDGLCKEGLVDEARKLIDKVFGSSLRYDELYSLLVLSLYRAGNHKESEKMVKMMIGSGMRPNDLAFGSVIEEMVSNGRVLDGFCLFDALEKSGNMPLNDSEIYSVLLAGLCQGQHFVEAREIANLMVERTILLKSSRVENIVEMLRSFGENDLASRIDNIKS